MKTPYFWKQNKCDQNFSSSSILVSCVCIIRITWNKQGECYKTSYSVFCQHCLYYWSNLMKSNFRLWALAELMRIKFWLAIHICPLELKYSINSTNNEVIFDQYNDIDWIRSHCFAKMCCLSIILRHDYRLFLSFLSTTLYWNVFW